jgi:hypothetical protein
MVAELENVGRNAVNRVVREEQNLNDTEECVQTRKQLASTTLDNTHTYKRSGTNFVDVDDVMLCETRWGGGGRENETLVIFRTAIRCPSR